MRVGLKVVRKIGAGLLLFVGLTGLAVKAETQALQPSTELSYQQLCRPFRMHRQAPERMQSSQLVSEYNKRPIHTMSERELVNAISGLPEHAEFAQLFEHDANQVSLPVQRRVSLLQCLLAHLMVDQDGDGIPNFSAIVNARPSTMVVPLDEDMDGDGVANVLDATPYEKNVVAKNKTNAIPEHLLVTNKAGREWQQKLYDDFRLLAIDFTDEHAPAVLEAIHQLLKASRLGSLSAQLKVKYLYAFRGHDRHFHQASYHPEMQAISVGGAGHYPLKNLSLAQKEKLWSAMAHEMGHATLFQMIGAQDFLQLGHELGPWKMPAAKPIKVSNLLEVMPSKWALYHPVFLKPHPEQTMKQSQWNAGQQRIVSQYALANLHEWFAESFAAAIFSELKGQGKLSEHWQQHLSGDVPGSAQAYWIQYEQVDQKFKQWIDARLNSSRLAQEATSSL